MQSHEASEHHTEYFILVIAEACEISYAETVGSVFAGVKHPSPIAQISKVTITRLRDSIILGH